MSCSAFVIGFLSLVIYGDAANTDLVWQSYPNPDPPLTGQGDFLNDLFNAGIKANAPQPKAVYRQSALPPPGPWQTGQFYQDGAMVVAKPYFDLEEEPQDILIPGGPFVVPAQDMYEAAPVTSVPADQNNLQRRFLKPGIPDPSSAPTYTSLTDLLSQFVMSAADLSQIQTAGIGITETPEKTTVAPSQDTAADFASLQRLFYYRGLEEATRKPHKYIVYPNNKAEFQLYAMDKSFNGWGDTRLNFLYNTPGKIGYKRTIVSDSNGGLRGVFQKKKVPEPIPVDIAGDLQGYNMPPKRSDYLDYYSDNF